MSDAATAVTWVALLVAVAAALLSVWRLRRGSPTGGGRNGKLATLLIVMMALLNAVPRLAGASSGLTLILSMLALMPLVGFVVLFTRTARTGQH